MRVLKKTGDTCDYRTLATLVSNQIHELLQLAVHGASCNTLCGGDAYW
jgi:hypothetical protein